MNLNQMSAKWAVTRHVNGAFFKLCGQWFDRQTAVELRSYADKSEWFTGPNAGCWR
jgi:hypothetical protein